MTIDLLCPECGGGRMHHLTFAHTNDCSIRAVDDQTAVNDAIRVREGRGSGFSRPATETELQLLRPLIVDAETGEDVVTGITVRVVHYGVHARNVTGIDRHGNITKLIEEGTAHV